MFALAQQQAERPKGRERHVAYWRLAMNGPDELHVTFLRSILRYDEVRPLFEWLLGNRNSAWRAITLDFERVRDIAAPWAPVFAHLEYVVSKTHAKCRLVGVNTRLASMASFALDVVAPRDGRRGSEITSQHAGAAGRRLE